MALDVRETHLRDCSVHSYFSRVLLDALSVPPLGQVFYAPRMPPTPRSGGDRESFRGNLRKNIDFAHFSYVSARSGSRELRAVKIPALRDAWRPSKRRKIDSRKTLEFFWSRKSVFCTFSWILEEQGYFKFQNQLPHAILLQIYRFSALSDP